MSLVLRCHNFALMETVTDWRKPQDTGCDQFVLGRALPLITGYWHLSPVQRACQIGKYGVSVEAFLKDRESFLTVLVPVELDPLSGQCMELISYFGELPDESPVI